MNHVVIALLFAALGGVMNGSFAIPSKYTPQWQFENTWLNYAFWGFVAFPWIIAYVLNGEGFWDIYSAVPMRILMILIVGGVLFGIGQVCFALALTKIGLGLGFLINIGLGTGLGLLLPLFVLHPDKLFSLFALVTLVGLSFIVTGLIFSYRAGKLRDAHKKMADSGRPIEFQGDGYREDSKQYLLGVLLAVAAGVFSGGQNFTFDITKDMQVIALSLGAPPLAASTVIWPLFLVSAFLPYAGYMIYLHKKHKTWKAYCAPLFPFVSYMLLTLLMGAFWYGSLIFYSRASLMIGGLGPVVAWPLFMVLIILTSNFWGWHYKEWEGAPKQAKRKALCSIGAFVLAILVLTYGAIL